MCYSTGIRYSTKKMRVLGVPCDGLCVCWYSTVWYVLRIEPNCVLLEKLKCKITQWSWEELLQLCKWMSEQRFCSIIRFLAEENLCFPIPLIRRSIPVVRGLEWGSARGLQNFWYIHRWIQYLNIFLNFSAEFCIFVQCIWFHQIIAKHSVLVFVSDSEFVLHFKYLVVLCLDSYVFGSFIPGEGEHCTEWWAFKSSSKSSRKSSKSRSSVGEEIPRFDTAIFRKISFTTNSKNIFGI